MTQEIHLTPTADYILHTYGRPNLRGHHYLILTAILFQQDPTRNFTDILKDVAQHFNTTFSRVERAIRHYRDLSNINMPISEWTGYIAYQVPRP